MNLIGKFALGMRFAPRPEAEEGFSFPEFAFENIFRILDTGSLAGMLLYGKEDSGEEAYLAVIVGGLLPMMRYIHQALAADPAFMALLMEERPFIENNRMRGDLTLYGEVGEDGSLMGADAPFSARPAVGKSPIRKHGKRRA